MISEKAVYDIIGYTAKKIPGVYSVARMTVINHMDGIEMSMDVILSYGYQIKETSFLLQKQIADEVEKMTAFNIKSVNITIKGLL